MGPRPAEGDPPAGEIDVVERCGSGALSLPCGLGQVKSDPPRSSAAFIAASTTNCRTTGCLAHRLCRRELRPAGDEPALAVRDPPRLEVKPVPKGRLVPRVDAPCRFKDGREANRRRSRAVSAGRTLQALSGLD